jgi:hypothetical protein
MKVQATVLLSFQARTLAQAGELPTMCWRAPASATTWTSGASSSRARRAIAP